jgi:hypothetical protein
MIWCEVLVCEEGLPDGSGILHGDKERLCL